MLFYRVNIWPGCEPCCLSGVFYEAKVMRINERRVFVHMQNRRRECGSKFFLQELHNS